MGQVNVTDDLQVRQYVSAFSHDCDQGPELAQRASLCLGAFKGEVHRFLHFLSNGSEELTQLTLEPHRFSPQDPPTPRRHRRKGWEMALSPSPGGQRAGGGKMTQSDRRGGPFLSPLPLHPLNHYSPSVPQPPIPLLQGNS